MLQGGPLVVLEEDDHWYLAGLVSQPSCGDSGQSVYTDLTSAPVILWLYEVVGDGYGPTTTTPITTGMPVTTEPAVTTGQPVGECFTTGSCDSSGPEHTGTVYGVGSPENCQAECSAGLVDCQFFTWYGLSEKC